MIYLVLLLGLFLRIINIDQSLWLDEAISANAAKSFSFPGLINEFSPGDTHPPGYYLLLKGWSSVFGYSEVAMRFLSVLFSLLAIYVIYLIGKTVSVQSGLLAATLLAISPLHIYYSQEIRMYPVSVFLVVLVILFYMNAARENENKYWISLAFVLLVLFTVDYLPMVIMFAIFIHMAVTNKKLLGKFFVVVLPSGVFGVLWRGVFFKQLFGSSTFLDQFPAWEDVLGKTTLKNMGILWSKFIIGRTSFDNDVLYAAVLVVVSFPIIYLMYRSLRRSALLFWLWLVVPVFVSVLGGFFVPGFSYFRLIFVLPAFYLILACGTHTGKWVRGAIGAVILISLFFDFYYITQKRFWREDWRQAVDFVESRAGTNTVVFLAFPEPFEGYSWYSKKPVSVFGVVPDLSQRVVDSELIKEVTAQKQDVYTFDYLMDLTDPGRSLFTNLESNSFEQKDVYDFRGIGQVRHWVKN